MTARLILDVAELANQTFGLAQAILRLEKNVEFVLANMTWFNSRLRDLEEECNMRPIPFDDFEQQQQQELQEQQS